MPRWIWNSAASLAMLTALAAPPALAEGERLVMDRAPSGHFLVPVTINDTGPYTFIFDTGASHTAIAQPIAEALGFVSQWERTGDVQSLTTRFEAERFPLRRFEFAPTGPLGLDAVVVPTDPDEPRPVAGLLGADAITSLRYAVDFSTGTLTYDADAAAHADGRVNPIGLLLAEARLLRGISHINVIIDSGSARSIVNPEMARNVRQRSNLIRYNINGVDDDIDMEAAPVAIRRFQIGGLCLDSVIALQADLDVFHALGWNTEPAIVLGMDVLQHASVTVDREAGIVQIDAAGDGIACSR
ncbi:aspartyl protease family protein [Hyphobacterium marinum]|uniref:Aspartyl protease family protein n=1 Tax=Hyphobacterium marinum TaxID=3116574 RepID=A0ABU7LWR3_9PROT|nr:aspartyl protease family protein [Hyphobacterium sp. Y6023]MEE2566001.1 aspartyl protease family protein [Hyphobacterium sp. Y6023]